MKKLRYSILNPLIFLIVLWQIRFWENVQEQSWVSFGIYPRDFSGLKGILTWVFIHGDDQHLLSNTFPLLILGTAIYYFYEKLANKVILMIYLFSGILVWIIGKPAFHIGASGLIYGLFGFLFFGGIFRKDRVSIALALLVTTFYGGIIWGIFPMQKGVSWEGHFAGLLMGFIMAFYYRKKYVEKPYQMQEVEDFRHPDLNVDFTIEGGLRQNTNTVVMIRPMHFGFNPETAESNVFQKSHELLYDKNLNNKALTEFDGMVQKLRSNRINVIVFEDQLHQELPDAVFPNNWISMHHDGKIVYYPMLAENRRKERREDVIDILVHAKNFTKTKTIDLTEYEKQGRILEGTGSMVLDHNYRVVYANLSARTNGRLLEEWCAKLNYYPVLFAASDKEGNEIYHTNVVMSVGEGFAVICLEVIRDEKQRAYIKEVFRRTQKEVIEITEEQMNNFCGNVLQLENNLGEKIIAMSTRAHDHFTEKQRETLGRFGKIVHSDLKTIENFGGGSARCMLAEVFLPSIQLRRKSN